MIAAGYRHFKKCARDNNAGMPFEERDIIFDETHSPRMEGRQYLLPHFEQNLCYFLYAT